MTRDLSRLVSFLEDEGLDGYLIDDDASDSDQRYVSGYDAPDPYQTLVTPDGQIHLLVSGLEYGRAKSESNADTVAPLAAYDFRALVDEYGAYDAKIRTIATFLDDHGVESLAVPTSFPTGTADGLREQGVTITVETDSIVERIRAVKTESEIERVRETQRANEAAMAVAEELIATAEVEGGTLVHGGEPLTSERVKREIEKTLLEYGCGLDETIVACGADAADPHDRGSGPLAAGELIVIDIFPRNKATKYHGDMTRTFVRGDPSEEARRRYEVTREAYDAGLEALEAGVTGAAVHDAVCDVIEDAGYETFRTDPKTETGFIHSTGHGVGLDVHERPHVSPDGEELEAGHVLTVEPGLYDPAVGGVRLEDLVVVTEDGYRNLTDYPLEIEPSIRT